MRHQTRLSIRLFCAAALSFSLVSCGVGGFETVSYVADSESLRRIASLPSGVHGLAVSGSGDFFYSDSFNRSRREVMRLREPHSQPATRTGITGRLPAGIEIFDGDLYLCDTEAGKVIRYDSDLRLSASYQASQPWNLTRMSDGTLISVSYGGGVESLTPGAAARRLFSGLDAPFDLVATPEDNLWISEQGQHGEGWVTLRTYNGEELERLGPLDNPEGLVLEENGDLWIADTGTGAILKYEAHSRRLHTITRALSFPIVGIETPAGQIVFNGAMGGSYGLFVVGN